MDSKELHQLQKFMLEMYAELKKISQEMNKEKEIRINFQLEVIKELREIREEQKLINQRLEKLEQKLINQRLEKLEKKFEAFRKIQISMLREMINKLENMGN